MYLLDEAGMRVMVDIGEVCVISSSRNGPLFITADGAAYRLPQTLDELEEVFGALGFRQLDRNAIVNMNKAVRFDPVERKVYFDENGGEGECFYATVSTANKNKVNHLLRESDWIAKEYGSYGSEVVQWPSHLIDHNNKQYSFNIFKTISSLCYN